MATLRHYTAKSGREYIVIVTDKEEADEYFAGDILEMEVELPELADNYITWPTDRELIAS